MARDIDVNEEELFKFIDTLSIFQQATQAQLNSVESAWNECNESWKGDAKNQFKNKFEVTKEAIERALDAGEQAKAWLERFDEIVKEFEHELY